jgi:hypothetical protein
MKLSTHIANRFLTDITIIEEIIHSHAIAHNITDLHKLDSTIRLMKPDGSQNYVITDTVIERLDCIKLKRPFKYQALSGLKDGKKTYVLPRNSIVRYFKQGPHLHIAYLSISNANRKTNQGMLTWHIWFANTDTGFASITKETPHTVVKNEGDGDVVYYGKFDNEQIDEVEQIVYSLLIFTQLTQVEEELLPPGRSHGTRKQGKVLNDLRMNFTLVTSKWNITSIRTEGFGVVGHIALRWTGPGRTIPKLVIIEPFQKHGYIRKAKRLDE